MHARRAAFSRAAGAAPEPIGSAGLNMAAPGNRAAAPSAAAPPGRRGMVRDIAYGTHGQALDLYMPGGQVPAKLVLYVHGGGWTGGNKAGGQKFGVALADAGYAVASIGYRLVPQTDIQGCVTDIAQAATFLLRNADRFGLDASRLALMGHSAGGHLAALAGTDPDYLAASGTDPARVAAIIALDGIFDIDAHMQKYAHAIKPEVFGQDRAVWHLLSPVSHLARLAGPILFGLAWETMVPRFGDQAALFSQALRARGLPVRRLIVPGLTHGELAAHIRVAGAPMLPFIRTCLAESLGAAPGQAPPPEPVRPAFA